MSNYYERCTPKGLNDILHKVIDHPVEICFSKISQTFAAAQENPTRIQKLYRLFSAEKT